MVRHHTLILLFANHSASEYCMLGFLTSVLNLAYVSVLTVYDSRKTCFVLQSPPPPPRLVAPSWTVAGYGLQFLGHITQNQIQKDFKCWRWQRPKFSANLLQLSNAPSCFSKLFSLIYQWGVNLNKQIHNTFSEIIWDEKNGQALLHFGGDFFGTLLLSPNCLISLD